MKKKLFVIGIILLSAMAVCGQTSDVATDKEMEEMLRESKEAALLAHKVSQTPFRALTETKDVREEAQKYFDAWVKKDAETILAYTPPFKLKDQMESALIVNPVLEKLGVKPKVDKEMKQIDLIKMKLEAISKDTFQYNSVKVGNIIESGILPDEYHKQANVFAVINFQADVYVRGVKDVMNANVVGYTDGKRWYFHERNGLTENLLKWVKSESPDSKVSGSEKNLESNIREMAKDYRNIYVAKFSRQIQLPSKGGIKKDRRGGTRVVDTFRIDYSNRFLVEKVYRGGKRKYASLRTYVTRSVPYAKKFEKGARYIVFYRSTWNYQTLKISENEQEIEILKNVLAKK